MRKLRISSQLIYYTSSPTDTFHLCHLQLRRVSPRTSAALQCCIVSAVDFLTMNCTSDYGSVNHQLRVQCCAVGRGVSRSTLPRVGARARGEACGVASRSRSSGSQRSRPSHDHLSSLHLGFWIGSTSDYLWQTFKCLLLL